MSPKQNLSPGIGKDFSKKNKKQANRKPPLIYIYRYIFCLNKNFISKKKTKQKKPHFIYKGKLMMSIYNNGVGLFSVEVFFFLMEAQAKVLSRHFSQLSHPLNTYKIFTRQMNVFSPFSFSSSNKIKLNTHKKKIIKHPLKKKKN